MKWAIVLHFYQPPVQDLGVTKQVLESSYLPVLDLLLANPRAKISINMTGCLLMQLKKMKQTAFFGKVSALIARGQIEILNTAAYHPVLPSVSVQTLNRQTQKNRQIIVDAFGIEPSKGFFIPELAANPEVISSLRRLCEYTIVDQSGISGPYLPSVSISDLTCFVNHRQTCDVFRTYDTHFCGKRLCDWVATEVGQTYLVTVSDVEAFGHHYEERLQVLEKVLVNPDFEFVKLEELLGSDSEPKEFSESSWQNLPVDKHAISSFWLWKNDENHLQKLYWELANTVENIFLKYCSHTEGMLSDSAANHLDTGLSSCYSYWLSNWPWWHPDLVERGLQQLVKCVRTIKAPLAEKRMIEERYHNLLKEIWGFHWSGQVEKNYEQYEIELKRIVSVLPDLS